MIDTASLPKNAPPAYITHESAGTSQPIELRQQHNIHVPVQKGYPVTLGTPSPSLAGPYPRATEDAATIGTRYQAELFALCARGEHQATRKYGPCGIITAVFLFPIGLFCLFSNSELQCSRCGVRLSS